MDFLGQQVADVAPADMVAQPLGFPNHPAWTIGHLAFTCEMLAGAVGTPPWLPQHWAARYGSGSKPVADLSRYESPTDALAQLRDAQSRIVGAVQQLTPSQLDTPFPDPAYHDVFPTVQHAITQVMVGHTAYHVGQVSAWRKAMNLRPMARSFE